MALETKDINNSADMRRYVEGCLNDLMEGLSTKDETMKYLHDYTLRVIDITAERVGQNAATSDEALPIADVVWRSEQFYCFDSSKDGGYKPKCDAQCDYCRRICPQ